MLSARPGEARFLQVFNFLAVVYLACGASALAADVELI